MSLNPNRPRVYILGNPDKPRVPAVLEELDAFARTFGCTVGSQLGLDTRDAVIASPDRIIVLGGDGTLLSVARSLGEHQIPLVGVNLGKLGFLAEFSFEELKGSFERVLTDPALISRRTALSVTIHRDGDVPVAGPAVNDCVIQAGPPYRMITLGVSINGEHLTKVRGDGLIVCTPSGSTAHSLSAGGPIVQPEVDALVLTPLNPHSLAHKPLVIESNATIDIDASVVNDGTTAILDGQVSHALHQGDRITVTRFQHDVLLVRNPAWARWHKLVAKLHWGQSPDYE